MRDRDISGVIDYAIADIWSLTNLSNYTIDNYCGDSKVNSDINSDKTIFIVIISIPVLIILGCTCLYASMKHACNNQSRDHIIASSYIASVYQTGVKNLIRKSKLY